MQKPKISIITPSFNQAEFLEETIQSVLNQNYPNLEYIVIDGGSNDRSNEIIAKYQDQLTFWVSEKDEGHGHALNKGFSRSSGEIMAWINSSDKYTPWTFEIVSNIFSDNPQVKWIMGCPTQWSVSGQMVSVSSQRHAKNIYDFLLGNYAWIQQESVFWRRSLWDESGGYIDQAYNFMIDCELWTRFFLYADLYFIPTVLSGFRIHADSRSTDNFIECDQEIKRAILKMRHNSSDQILDNLKKFESIKKSIELCKRNPILKRFPIEKVFKKWIYTDAFAEASYKDLFYNHSNKGWEENNYPFTLFDSSM